jgi:hypothetical protein
MDCMPRILFSLWLVGVVIFVPIVFTADRFFVREYGPFVGYLVGFAIWAFKAALSYIALRFFTQTFLEG